MYKAKAPEHISVCSVDHIGKTSQLICLLGSDNSLHLKISSNLKNYRFLQNPFAQKLSKFS